MKGIKEHSRAERSKIVTLLIPILKKKYKNNFLALAADGSYARGEDKTFSDLELIVFLKHIPKDVDWSVHKIIDGMLVVLVPETKESFIQKYFEVTRSWYVSGAGRLLPIVNDKLVNEINEFIPEDIEDKCLGQIRLRWPEYQEITAKLLNSIKQKDINTIPVVFPVMFRDILAILSFINRIPYVTMSKQISTAEQFKVKPKEFDDLTKICVSGNYKNLKLLEQKTLKVFSFLENYMERKGQKLYLDNINDI